MGLLTGCATKKENTDTQPQENTVTPSEDNVSTDGEKEVVLPKNLKIYGGIGNNSIEGGAKDNNDLLAFQMMEKMTGTHVEWTHPAQGAVDEQFNLLIASEEYPDAIVYKWPTVPGGASSYAEDDVIIELTDMIETCMPNFWAYLQENPDVKKQISDDDGRIFYIPFIRKDDSLRYFMGYQTRSDFLEAVDMEVPKTIDELYDLLVAYKKQDFSGKSQEKGFPLTGVGFDGFFGIGKLLWSFGTTYDFHLGDDGKVVYGPMTDDFVEGLTFIRKLYEEGLIDPDYLLNDRAAMDSNVMNGTSGVIYSYQSTKYYTSESFNDGTKKIVAIPALAGPDGKNYSFNTDYTNAVVIGTTLAITTENKNPEGTLAWLDNFYGGEGYNYANFGEEGVTYNWEDGYPKYTDRMFKNPDDPDMAVGSIFGINCLAFATSFPMLQDGRYYEQYLSEWASENIKDWVADEPDMSRVLPKTLTFTEEENKVIAQAMAQIKTYVATAWNNVVIGKMDISEWNNVCEQLVNMGIEDVVKIYNDSYERYQNR